MEKEKKLKGEDAMLDRKLKRVYRLFYVIGLAMFFLSGCSPKEAAVPISAIESEDQLSAAPKSSNQIDGKESLRIVKLKLDNQDFQLELEENETVEELTAQFPLSLELEDLNQNEKYAYLSKALPTAPQRIVQIEKGDVLLFGSDCLVIFYESFETNYTYTRIGKIKEAAALDFLKERKSVWLWLG
ncbi:cyclophilin-like fold protein [Enterococcus sp. LJL51]|uniref:cyclophilin-like fold protein n=1 Tax=Enterococcus sp. LJL51 TaxID=3416656 RepID=UPI003CEBD4B0